MKAWIKNTAKRFALWLIKGTIGAIVIFASLIVIAEWMAGCGESYTDAYGVVHANGCMILSNTKQ